jgi:flagellar basal body-associated protein FliL
LQLLLQSTDKARKLSSAVVLIIICVIPIVGLAYLFVPSIPVSNTLTLPVANTSALTNVGTSSYVNTFYRVSYLVSSEFIPCLGVVPPTIPGGPPPDVIIASCPPSALPCDRITYYPMVCWHFYTVSSMTTSSYTDSPLVFTLSTTSSFTFTSQTITTTSTILPPSALYQESKVATIAMIALLAVGLCYLLFLMMNRRKTKESKPQIQEAITEDESAKRAEPNKKTTMFCKECGATMSRDSKFCKECGTKTTG